MKPFLCHITTSGDAQFALCEVFTLNKQLCQSRNLRLLDSNRSVRNPLFRIYAFTDGMTL